MRIVFCVLISLLILTGCSNYSNYRPPSVNVYEVLDVVRYSTYQTNMFGHHINQRDSHIVTYIVGNKIQELDLRFGEHGLNKLRLSSNGKNYMERNPQSRRTTVYLTREFYSKASKD